jgi:hypothetical protein
MKSRVTAEIQFPSGTPVIQIDWSPSEDVRDKIVDEIFNRLSGESSWFRIENVFNGTEKSRWIIIPITPQEMKSESEQMSKRWYESFPQKEIKITQEKDPEPEREAIAFGKWIRENKFDYGQIDWWKGVGFEVDTEALYNSFFKKNTTTLIQDFDK